MEIKFFRAVSVVFLIGMFLAMFLIENTNASLTISVPCAIIAGLSMDAWWKK